MRRMNNLITLFSAMVAFFFGCFLSTTLNNIEKCSQHRNTEFGNHRADSDAHYGKNSDIFLLILILTAPNYFKRREIIRDTWLKFTKPTPMPYYSEDFIFIPEFNENNGFLESESILEQSNSVRSYADWFEQFPKLTDIQTNYNIRTKHVFAIGTKNLNPATMIELQQEQENYQDLLLLDDLHDSYSSLTNKLLKSIVQLTKTYNFKYLLKTDDDTYVKLDLLKNELISYDTKVNRKSISNKDNLIPELYWGYFHGNANIKIKGQWKETNYNLCTHYGPYALGGGYVISKNIADYIAMNSKILNKYMSEDVSMGTWLSPLRNVYRRHDIRFDTGYMPRKCNKHHLVLHKRTIKQMTDLYENKLCTFENANEQTMKRPLEYYYNWEKSPDKCCTAAAVEIM